MILTSQQLKRIPNWVWVVPILLLASALIARHLTTDVYWFDELANLRKMGIPPYPPATILEMVNNVGVTRWPPAYNFVLLAWGGLVGWSEMATRTLSLLIGVLSVAMMYRLGKSLYHQRVGFISTLLLSTSVFFVFYSHEVRGYIQYLFLTITLLYLYWHQSHKSQLSRSDGFWFVLFAILLIYTHYVALYVVVAMGIYHLVFAPRTNYWGKRLRWLIYTGIAYIPWVAIAVLNAVGETIKDRGLDPIIIIETTLYSFSNGLSLLLLGLIIYTLIVVRDRATGMLIFLGTIFFVCALITNVLTDFLFHIRHIIGLLPLLILVSAVAIDHLLNRTRGFAWLFVVIWVGAGLFLNRDLTFMDNLPGALENRPLDMMTTVTSVTDTCTTSDDFVITHLASQQHIWNKYVEEYYLWQPDFTLAMIDTMVNYSHGHDNTEPDGTYESRFLDYMTPAERTWVFIADDAYDYTRVDYVGSTLAQHYDYCDTLVHTSGVRAYLYQHDADVTCTTEPISLPTLSTCSPTLMSD